MDDQQRKHAVATIVSDSASVLRSYADGSGLAFELGTNLVTAEG